MAETHIHVVHSIFQDPNIRTCRRPSKASSTLAIIHYCRPSLRGLERCNRPKLVCVDCWAHKQQDVKQNKLNSYKIYVELSQTLRHFSNKWHLNTDHGKQVDASVYINL